MQVPDDAVEIIKKKDQEVKRVLSRLRAYQRDRVREEDHHGAWDAAIDLARKEAYRSGLWFALEVLGHLDP